MKAYQEQLRQQLRQEMERFNKEQKEIEAQLLEAREYLEKLERGEPIEDIKEPAADVTDGPPQKRPKPGEKSEIVEIEDENAVLGGMDG